MFIRKVKNKYKGREYFNYQLVESVRTEKGPRHKVVCSLGSLAPRSPEDWLKLSSRIEGALRGQDDLFDQGTDDELPGIISKIRNGKKRRGKAKPELQAAVEGEGEVVAVKTGSVRTEDLREAGPAHAGNEFWKRLGMGSILEGIGLSERAVKLTCAMTLNRLIHPSSEHAMPNWIRRVALSDIIGEDFSKLSEDSLYCNLDRLHPLRTEIESSLAERERSIFNLDDSILLYDLTSTYFEGAAELNPKAIRGYSRDKRPDCKQVIIGLAIGQEGFPVAHEVFKGNLKDSDSLGDMLDAMEKRTGPLEGRTLVIDRGMAFDKNIDQVKSRKMHYIVAARQAERNQWLDEFEDLDAFEKVLRESSPQNPCREKSEVSVRMLKTETECHILCLSGGRAEKDRAIREKQEKRLLCDIRRLETRIDKGLLREPIKIGEAIGRLKERYPRVSRYYPMSYDAGSYKLTCVIDEKKHDLAARMDGAYMLRTDRMDMTADQAWRTYTMLTRAENAFRSMKSPLLERPIFHHLEHRVETHIFLCVLAYHILTAVELTLRRNGLNTSWATVRDTLSSHQICTVVLPAENGDILRIRSASTPEKEHVEIYRLLGIDRKIITPIRTWIRMNGN
jgi:transposase